jgi:DNA-binding winged helix-turn-helix (wHTH) protein
VVEKVIACATPERKLRKKLQIAGADNLIGTVWGRGYMLRDPSGEAAPAKVLDKKFKEEAESVMSLSAA